MPPADIERRPRRGSNMGLIIGVIVILALLVGGYFYLFSGSTPEPVQENPIPTAPVVVDTLQTYASSTWPLSIKYPQGYTADANYRNTSVNPQKPIMGVKFTVPMEMATGTNLSADSGISVEQLPRASLCTGDIYLAANVKSTNVTDGGVRYSVATSSEAATGNLYEEFVFAVASSTPCTAVRYFIHSTQLANYPEGTVRAFDRAALLLEFDKIRQSLVLQ